MAKVLEKDLGKKSVLIFIIFKFGWIVVFILNEYSIKFNWNSPKLASKLENW